MIRNQKIVGALVLSTLLLWACQPKAIDAVKYNDELIKNQIAVSQAVMQLSKAFKKADTLEMQSAYYRATFVLDSAYQNVQRIGDFDADSTYRHQVSSLLLVYKSTMNNEYSRVISLYKLPAGEFDMSTMREMEELVISAYEKIQIAIDTFSNQQQAFAQKYNFKVMAVSNE